MNDYVVKIVQERKQSNYEEKDDLLSLYVKTAIANKKSYMMEEGYLVDTILNFMIAGRDTTACTLTNMFKFISLHPEVEQKMLEELDRVVGRENNVTWDNIRELRYCGACFNECIRMYPPVPGDGRAAINDDVLPSGIHIKAGSQVILPIFSIGRDPHLFNDPNKFIPERWLEEDKPTRRPDEYVLPVFWGGPRLCLGKDMARLEALSITYTVLKKYRVKVLRESEHFVTGPVMFYADGLPVTLQNREE